MEGLHSYKDIVTAIIYLPIEKSLCTCRNKTKAPALNSMHLALTNAHPEKIEGFVYLYTP